MITQQITSRHTDQTDGFDEDYLDKEFLTQHVIDDYKSETKK